MISCNCTKKGTSLDSGGVAHTSQTYTSRQQYAFNPQNYNNVQEIRLAFQNYLLQTGIAEHQFFHIPMVSPLQITPVTTSPINLNFDYVYQWTRGRIDRKITINRILDFVFAYYSETNLYMCCAYHLMEHLGRRYSKIALLQSVCDALPMEIPAELLASPQKQFEKSQNLANTLRGVGFLQPVLNILHPAEKRSLYESYMSYSSTNGNLFNPTGSVLNPCPKHPNLAAILGSRANLTTGDYIWQDRTAGMSANQYAFPDCTDEDNKCYNVAENYRKTTGKSIPVLQSTGYQNAVPLYKYQNGVLTVDPVQKDKPLNTGDLITLTIAKSSHTVVIMHAPPGATLADTSKVVILSCANDFSRLFRTQSTGSKVPLENTLLRGLRVAQLMDWKDLLRQATTYALINCVPNQSKMLYII